MLRLIPNGSRAFRPALYLAGEAAWLTVAANVVGRPLDPDGSSPLLGPASVLLALALAALATRLVLRLTTGDRLRASLIVAAALMVAITLASATVVPSAVSFERNVLTGLIGGRNGLRWVGAVILSLIAFWRGVPAGREALDAETVNGSFRTSMSALAVLFLLNALAGSSAQVVAGLYVLCTIVAVASGLIGLPLARLDQLARRASPGDGGRLRTSRQWLGMLVGTVGALVFFTGLLGVVLTFERINRVVDAVVRPLSDLIGLVLYVILLPIGYLMQFLIETIRSLQRPSTQPQNAGPTSALLDAVRKQTSTGNADLDMLFAVLKWLLAALVVAIILWVIARAVSRYLVWSSPSDLEETRDFVWSWAEAIAAIRAWLRARWRSARVPLNDPDSVSSTPASQDWTRDIRSVYRALLRLGASRGRPRAPTETPRDYEKVLVSLLGLEEMRVEVAAVTESYVEERYGDRPVEPERLERAVEAMLRLEGQ